jgi:hypothetical protein
VFVVPAGLALGLSDTLRNETVARAILFVGLLFLVVCLIVGAWRNVEPRVSARRQAQIDEVVVRAVREHFVRDVRPWVLADVQRVIAENAEGGRKLAEILLNAPSETTQPMTEAKLRLALNEISEELEYILDRIAEDEPGYWHRFTLPKVKWIAHGSMIAATDNSGHETLRAAYREADRINHCLRDQATRYDDDGNMLNGKSVEDCEPGRYEVACHNATVQIKRMLADLAAGR